VLSVCSSIETVQKDGVEPGPNQQQCRSNVRLCRSNIRLCRKDEISTQNSFDIVAVLGNKIERCFDIVAGVNGVSYAVWRSSVNARRSVGRNISKVITVWKL